MLGREVETKMFSAINFLLISGAGALKLTIESQGVSAPISPRFLAIVGAVLAVGNLGSAEASARLRGAAGGYNDPVQALLLMDQASRVQVEKADSTPEYVEDTVKVQKRLRYVTQQYVHATTEEEARMADAAGTAPSAFPSASFLELMRSDPRTGTSQAVTTAPSNTHSPTTASPTDPQTETDPVLAKYEKSLLNLARDQSDMLHSPQAKQDFSAKMLKILGRELHAKLDHLLRVEVTIGERDRAKGWAPARHLRGSGARNPRTRTSR